MPSLPGLELRCDETFFKLFLLFSLFFSFLFLHGHTGLLEWIEIHIPIDDEEDDREDDEYDYYHSLLLS